MVFLENLDPKQFPASLHRAGARVIAGSPNYRDSGSSSGPSLDPFLEPIEALPNHECEMLLIAGDRNSAVQVKLWVLIYLHSCIYVKVEEAALPLSHLLFRSS